MGEDEVAVDGSEVEKQAGCKLLYQTPSLFFRKL